eukprot:gene40015-48752_t
MNTDQMHNELDLHGQKEQQLHGSYELVDLEQPCEAGTQKQREQFRRQASIALNPHKGTTLEWTNVNYDIVARGGGFGSFNLSGSFYGISVNRRILSNVSGKASPGELVAIMGRSGAGKTTLLDVLSGRLESPSLAGQLTLDGRHIDKRTLRMETGYVMQSDSLFSMLTVRETIHFAAMLRVPNKSAKHKALIAEDIINLLGLQECADTQVGDDEHRGLSGGEKRRVSIAVDIVHFPAVIFLDEPTSGLDSTTALTPSARLFELIDKVMFLSSGRMTYFGTARELDGCIQNTCLKTGRRLGFNGNLPELFLDLCEALDKSKQLYILTEQYDTEDTPHSQELLAEGLDRTLPYANDTWSEIYVLVRRSLLIVMRTKELFLLRLVLTIALYYFTSLDAMPVFLNEREIFRREYSRGAYRGLSYTIASQVVQLPFFLIMSLVFCGISWWLIDLPNVADNFFFMVFCVFTLITVGNAFTTAISVFVPNPMIGQTIGSTILSVMFLFSGFFIKTSDIPDYWLWLHYLSLFKYGYDSMAVNILKYHFSIPDVMSNADVLEYCSVNGQNRGLGVGVLWAWVLVFRLIFYGRLVTAFNGSRK